MFMVLQTGKVEILAMLPQADYIEGRKIYAWEAAWQSMAGREAMCSHAVLGQGGEKAERQKQRCHGNRHTNGGKKVLEWLQIHRQQEGKGGREKVCVQNGLCSAGRRVGEGTGTAPILPSPPVPSVLSPSPKGKEKGQPVGCCVGAKSK